MLKGYSVNNQRLEYLEKTVKLINITGRIDDDLKSNEAGEIIKVINSYSKALNLLDNYDRRNISKPKGTTTNKMITYKKILGAIYQSFDENDL